MIWITMIITILDYNDSTEMANIFNDYFVGIPHKLDRDIPAVTIDPCSYVTDQSVNSFYLEPVSPREVFDIFSKLKRTKSSKGIVAPVSTLLPVMDTLTVPLSTITISLLCYLLWTHFQFLYPQSLSVYFVTCYGHTYSSFIHNHYQSTLLPVMDTLTVPLSTITISLLCYLLWTHFQFLYPQSLSVYFVTCYGHTYSSFIHNHYQSTLLPVMDTLTVPLSTITISLLCYLLWTHFQFLYPQSLSVYFVTCYGHTFSSFIHNHYQSTLLPVMDTLTVPLSTITISLLCYLLWTHLQFLYPQSLSVYFVTCYGHTYSSFIHNHYQSFSSGIFPSVYKHAEIIPVLKTGCDEQNQLPSNLPASYF